MDGSINIKIDKESRDAINYLRRTRPGGFSVSVFVRRALLAEARNGGNYEFLPDDKDNEKVMCSRCALQKTAHCHLDIYLDPDDKQLYCHKFEEIHGR